MEIVHCKECKHAVMTYGGEVKYCLFWQNAIDDEDGPLQALYLDGDFFCAGGDRKDTSVKQLTYDGDATGYITARRQGTWIKMTGSMPPKYTGHYECSECGWHGEAYERRETDYDFCPHCGAIMSK